MVVGALTIVPFLPAGYIERLSTITDIEADQTGSAQGRWNDLSGGRRRRRREPDPRRRHRARTSWRSNEARGRDDLASVHNAYLEYAVDLGLPGTAAVSVAARRELPQRAARWSGRTARRAGASAT